MPLFPNGGQNDVRANTNTRSEGTTVLVCLNSLELGGTQINALDLADKARTHGFHPYLVGWAGPRMGLLGLARERNVSVEVLPRAETSVGRARALAAVAARVRPHLVHVYGGVDARAGFWGPARWGRVPLILTVYEMHLPRHFYRHPGLVVGTGYLADDARSRPGPTRLISPPVDMDRDRPGAVDPIELPHLGVSSSSIHLVMVTRVDEAMKARHIEAAILSVRHLPPEVVLIIVGTGDAFERLRRLAAMINSDLGRRAVHLVGEMADPRSAYAVADIVIGMGSSAARGLSFGKPLLVIGEYGAPELFSPETSASIFYRSFWNEDRPGSGTASVHELLMPLVDDPAFRHRLGAYGRAFAEESFGLDRMSERLVDLYRSITPSQSWRGGWVRDVPLDLRSAPRLLRTHASPRRLLATWAHKPRA
ncbi:glycosyltransferase [Knoellia sp. CPCC 206435]|uniref:glycosyltransferase n=1 Tax=Knoellia terrae TaxID=3404797 RepID=UPI003B42AD43